MKLTDKERLVVAALQLSGERPLTELEAETGLPVSTIRYHLKSLLDRGVLQYCPFINVYPLGYTFYSMYFSLSYEGLLAKDKLINYLISSEKVGWFAELGGNYQFCATIMVKSALELAEFLEKLGAKFGSAFSRKRISCQIALNLFPVGYLFPKGHNAPQRTVAWGDTGQRVEIDDTDHRILMAVIEIGQSSRRELARKIGVPSSTIDSRLKKLRDKGILVELVYLVNVLAFDMQSFKLLVYTKGIDPKFHHEFYEFCRNHPHIDVLLHCVGSWDYELSVEVANGNQIVEIAAELQSRFGGQISLVEEMPLFSQLKASTYPLRDRSK